MKEWRRYALLVCLCFGGLLGGAENAFSEETPNNLMFQAFPKHSEGGYTDKRTVLQGEAITFYIANALESFPLEIDLFVATSGPRPNWRTVKTFQRLTGNAPDSPCNVQLGCNWKSTFRLTIPENWASGIYRASFPVKLGPGPRFVDFVVAEKTKDSDILILADAQRAFAYNAYAGQNFYASFDKNKKWTSRIKGVHFSFRRPMAGTSAGAGSSPPNSFLNLSFVNYSLTSRLLTVFGKIAFITNDRMENLSLDYLQKYKMIFVHGSQEYLSRSQIDLLKNYVRKGGNIFYSAREFGYGLIRLDKKNDRMIFARDPKHDPLFSKDPGRVTSYIYKLREHGLPTHDPGSFFGVTMEIWKQVEGESKSPFYVIKDGSWVFTGTGYKNGNTILEVRGLMSGAWVEQGADGRYCITSSRIDCDRVEILALSSPHFVPRWKPSKNWKVRAILALIQHGKGKVFIAPPSLLSSDERGLRRVAANVVGNFIGASESRIQSFMNRSNAIIAVKRIAMENKKPRQATHALNQKLGKISKSLTHLSKSVRQLQVSLNSNQVAIRANKKRALRIQGLLIVLLVLSLGAIFIAWKRR